MPEQLLAEKAHIRCKAIIEVLGKPKEHIEKTLRMYVDKVKNDSELALLNAEFANPQSKENLWMIFVELDIIFKGIPKLIAFCFDYMPSSVEILKPEDFAMRKTTIENFINDLQARLHHVDMVVKKQKSENEFLKKNLNKAIINVILISLARGGLNKEALSKVTGIYNKELGIFLDKLVKENKIKEENNDFFLV